MTGPEDKGTHTVCAKMNKQFLEFTKKQGNDLSSVVKPGDRWCVCARTWQDAAAAGVACPIDLGATHEETLQVISLELLEQYAV